MNEVKVFNEQVVLGKEFKMYGSVEQPLFLAKDVAAWIEHSNTSKMLNTIDNEEKTTLTISYNGNMTTNQLFVTEDGLYEVLMQSRKPIAKEFKKEVKKILKQIRLTGGTVVENREEEFIHNYFPSFSEDVKKAMVLDLRKQNQEMKTIIEKQKPLVEMCMKRRSKEGLVSYTDIQETFELKRGQIGTWLKLNGYVHMGRNEVNSKGKGLLRVYGEEYQSVGVTEEGVAFINDNIEEIRKSPCSIKKEKKSA